MSTEQRLLDFVDSRLESLLRHPSAWGPPGSVEDQLLQLLELRRYLLDASLTPRDTRKLTRSYARFIERVLGADATPEPLAAQLERRGRLDELTRMLRAFVDEEIATGQRRARRAQPIYFQEHRQQP